MFAVKEYDQGGVYIGHTPYLNDKEAIILAKRISKTRADLQVIVTEIDYNDTGDLFEIIVWDSTKES